MLGDTLHTVQCLDNLLFTFEDERYGDDTDRKDVHFFGYAGYDGSSARTCSATHSGSDEYHFCTVVQ